MSPGRAIVFAGGLALAVGHAGCSPESASPGAESTEAHAEHGHDHEHGAADGHEYAAGDAPARFVAGHGLQLAEPTARALGVQSEVASRRTLTPRFELTATVFDPGPPAQASALVPAELAQAVSRHAPSGVSVLAVREDASAGRTEVVLALSNPRPLGAVIALTVEGAARPALAVPAAATLRTATGTFLFVVEDDFLVRRAVETGASDGEWVEVVRGLDAGARVVTSAVEELWLTELRLTKGGGHSH
ncbi:hypothetical protein [Opitutus terrae]|uniref:YknX-like C-terminal permuted SH3-like domain-containing protein n=1 Tax=Opitutus terrae (strain DSM 11246 / JCM 15787 / PB90-1) TaxID=452637 RepID=B1ZYA3_OPITP|nr:hypothetical protein [Opitutus terrae]ACB76249.1 hypothetical protein Oter_2968 [Opitutus terrae PB90-1]